MYRALAVISFGLAGLGLLGLAYVLIWPIEGLDQSWAATTLVFAGLLVFLGWRLWATAPGSPKSSAARGPTDD